MYGETINIKELEKKRDELLKQAEAISVVLKMYNPSIKDVIQEAVSIHQPNIRSEDYTRAVLEDRKSTVGQKVIAIIKCEGRFLYRKEILAIAKKHNKPFENSITSTLSHANKNPESELALFMYQGNAGVWGLKSWLTEDGKILPERAFIENKEYAKK